MHVKGLIMRTIQTRKELSSMYKLSPNTLRRRLREIGIEPSRKRLSIKQMRLIYAEMGEPEEVL